MENQHRRIAGYRELSAREIDVIAAPQGGTPHVS